MFPGMTDWIPRSSVDASRVDHCLAYLVHPGYLSCCCRG
uniref:Uncharacterized protein n=1 Tax=Arundo donax TaxID=35708 RepID=A0A0A8Y5D5_ARUDO